VKKRKGDHEGWRIGSKRRQQGVKTSLEKMV
jgi:hypothetical protein